MDQKQQLALIERYVAAYNAIDVEAMMAPLHEEVAFRNVSGGEVTHETKGLAAFRVQAEEGARMFAARAQRITGTKPIADGGDPGLTVGIAYSGVLARDLPNGAKAGDAIELTGESEFRFREGKIVAIIDQS